MYGGEVPELDRTPCPVCGERIAADEAVWDPYHTGERRWAALPYHRACAGDVLPPPEPGREMRRCARCGEELAPEVLAEAFAALLRRFEAPTAPAATPEVVWRLAERAPRRYLPEHFRCVLGALGKA